MTLDDLLALLPDTRGSISAQDLRDVVKALYNRSVTHIPLYAWRSGFTTPTLVAGTVISDRALAQLDLADFAEVRCAIRTEATGPPPGTYVSAQWRETAGSPWLPFGTPQPEVEISETNVWKVSDWSAIPVEARADVEVSIVVSQAPTTPGTASIGPSWLQFR